MYIVSKFRDYYDSAATYGIDKTCVYRREVQEPIKIELPRNRNVLGSSDNQTPEKFVVGFCGELYPGVITYTQTGTNLNFYYKQSEYEKTGLGLGLGYFSITEDDFWNPETWAFLKENFQKYKTPVFAVADKTPVLSVPERTHRRGISIHPDASLIEYGFYRVKPPAQAFQEIFQYLSGVLGTGQNPMVAISDKNMAKKKGFDDRSFKKDPGQKKRGKNKTD